MFSKVLIANRGEIAVRVIRTAKAMGLRTVAVYSEADRGAMHVAIADEAVLLGPSRARDSYLNIERVIDAARQSGAEAIHPGYGFLSENADLAQACVDTGLVFVGPTAAMMNAMRSKSDAKRLMEKAGVPNGPINNIAQAFEEPQTIARGTRIDLPHPKGGTLDVSAPLPPHMQQSFSVLAFEEHSGEEAAERL